MKQREWRRQCHRRTLSNKRRLFWRLYGFGLLIVLLALISFAQSGNLVGVQSPWHKGHNEVRAMMEAPGANGEPVDKESLELRVHELALFLDMGVAVYTADGKLLAASGDEIPEPMPAEVFAEQEGDEWVWKDRDGWMVNMATPVDLPLDGRHYVIARHHWRDFALTGLVGIMLVLFACAVVMYPLTRRIVRPLERIARAANRFGSGDLDARTDVARKDEIGQLATAFDRMADRIQQLVLSEKELLANVSHEFRTPLARIRVALELASESQDSGKIHQRLSGIEEDIDELNRLVEDVLIAARLDQNGDAGFTLRPDTVRVEELVDSSVDRLQRAHPEVAVATALEKNLDSLYADPVLLRRLLDNVLDNAAKYARKDDGNYAPITVSARQSDQEIQIEVRDRGPGIPDTDLERLTEPFFRGDRSRGTGGVGLGLALCQRITEIHGGQLTFEDNDPGLAVIVTLPLVPDQ